MGQPTTTNPAEYHDYGITSTDPNWRNWFLTSAMELSLPTGKHFPAILGGLTSPDIQAALPPGAWVNSWTMRLNAEKSESAKPMSVGFLFPPTPGYESEGKQRYILNLRRAVTEFQVIEPWTESDDLAAKDPVKAWEMAEVQIQMTRAALRNLLIAEAEAIKKRARENSSPNKPDNSDPFLAALIEAIQKGQVKLLKGNPAQVEAFFKNFDSRMTHAPYLTVR